MAQNGESSGSGAGANHHSAGAPSQSLDDAIAAAANPPGIVVLETDYYSREERRHSHLNPKEDLWLTTVDGRFGSPTVPIRVGQIPNIQTFYVHRDILLRSEWFRKALCGDFREATSQAIDLPEEDPAIFHFLIAFLYENRFNPIKPAASVLDPIVDKGKGREHNASDGDSSDSSSASHSSGSSSYVVANNRRRRRRAEEDAARLREKHPGQHRLDCHCPRCTQRERPRCWNCGVLPVMSPDPVPVTRRRGVPPPPTHTRPAPPGSDLVVPATAATEDETERIIGEDMRTWLLTYELNLDVYICANRFLMDDFKIAVMRSCIDMLETAGTDAAQPEVLRLCLRLHAGVPETDPLLRMVLARVGFLQSLLWKRAPAETGEFLVTNPEIVALMLRETVMRHEVDTEKRVLPSMEGERLHPEPRTRTRTRGYGREAVFMY